MGNKDLKLPGLPLDCLGFNTGSITYLLSLCETHLSHWKMVIIIFNLQVLVSSSEGRYIRYVSQSLVYCRPSVYGNNFLNFIILWKWKFGK